MACGSGLCVEPGNMCFCCPECLLCLCTFLRLAELCVQLVQGNAAGFKLSALLFVLAFLPGKLLLPCQCRGK